MIHYNPTISGSLTVTGSIIVTEEISGTITASYVDFDSIANKPTLVSGSSQLTSSLDSKYIISGSITETTWNNIASKPDGIVSSSAQVKTLLPNGSVSGSIQVLGGTDIVSGSTQILGLGFVTGSYVTINEYNYLTQSFNIISASVVTIENDIDAGIYATTGSNTFIGTQIFTGSVYISENLIVQGSSSLENITASAVSIGTNIVYLNTDTPAIRFAGISVFDSGSTDGTGSLFYDSENERWVYQKSSGSSYSGGMLISGPRNNGLLGEEVGMPNNKLIMGIGGDHISSSNIYHNGTDTAFAGNVEITGSLIAPQIISLNTYTSSNDTTNTTQNSRLTSIESVTGSYETKGRGIVSGSSQIDVISTTNIARLATTGSNIFIGNQTITGSIYTTGTGSNLMNLVTTQALSSGYNDATFILAPNQTGGGLSFNIGKAASSYNLGKMVFNYVGDQSTSNNISFGFYNYDNKLVIEGSGTVRPGSNGTQDLGSSSNRWSTVYTSDLSLNNGIGDWTIVEGEDDLFLYNNKKGKVYKFALTEVDPSVATPKKS